jgi:hypothetical protein
MSDESKMQLETTLICIYAEHAFFFVNKDFISTFNTKINMKNAHFVVTCFLQK